MHVIQTGRILLAVALGMHGSDLLAQDIHFYDGAAFQTPDAPYTVSDRVAGHFGLTVKLPPEFAMSDVRSLMADLHFFDGLATRRMSDSVMCLFRVSTDADGVVSSAEIWLRQSDTAVDEHQHSLEVYDFLDQVGFDVGVGRPDCGAVGLVPFASVNGGGTWSNGSLFSDGFEGSWPEMRSPGYP